MQWEFDINDSDSISKWESSAFNLYRSKVLVMNFVFLGGHFDKPESLSGWALKPFPVEVCGMLDGPPRPEQRDALEQLVLNEKAIYKGLREAMYSHYKEVDPLLRDAIEAYFAMRNSGEPHSPDEILPEVRSGNELDRLVEFRGIYALRPKGGISKIGMIFDCEWDPEHGLGAVISGANVESFGSSDVFYAAV